MAIQLYPSTIQDNFARGTYVRAPGNNVIESEMELGPPKRRRRSTSRRDRISGQITLDNNTQYETFMDWFTITLKDGTEYFYFNDPVTAAQMVVSFVNGAPEIRDIGFQAYSVSLTMEIISE